jgi:hypothetical protein
MSGSSVARDGVVLLLGASLACGPNDDARIIASDAGDDVSSSSRPRWRVVLSNLDATLLSVWGSAPDDVYAVGGPLGNGGEGTAVLHFNGAAWKRLAPGGTETFWWTYGASATDVWMVGERGRITHWDGGRFHDFPSGTSATLYGVWAASAVDAWAVGGTPDKGTLEPNDVLLHWDGSAWSPSPLPGAPMGRALFKVWGTNAQDLYIVGEGGTIWHRTQARSRWELESNPPFARGSLLTVFGCNATEIYAVGARNVLRSDGARWTKLDVALDNDVNGVACRSAGEVAIVGFGGLKERLAAGTWTDDLAQQPYGDLHSTWADPSGAFWAVGGDFTSAPLSGAPRHGVIARFGASTVSSVLE